MRAGGLPGIQACGGHLRPRLLHKGGWVYQHASCERRVRTPVSRRGRTVSQGEQAAAGAQVGRDLPAGLMWAWPLWAWPLWARAS